MVLLQEKVHLYDITNMKELHTIDTPSNPKGNSRRLKVAAALHPQIYVGIGALSPSSENIYLACLSQQNTGDLLIFDALNLSPLTVIQAHKSPIAFVTFNDTGTLLATASDKVNLPCHGFP